MSNFNGLRIIDVGCGLGLRGETISENGHHWIGLDILASMLSMLSFEILFVIPIYFEFLYICIRCCGGARG